MTRQIFGNSLFVVVLGLMGGILAIHPRLVPRLTNAYYKMIHMKSRLDEEDYDKLGIRFAGIVGLLLAGIVFATKLVPAFR